MAKQLPKFSEQIKQAIDGCGKTRYQIWKETGIAQSTLSEFMAGGRGMSMANLDLLAECLGLQITVKKPIKRKGK